VPRNFGDIVRRVSRGYGIPETQAASLLGRPVFTISIDDLTDEEASDVFVLRPSIGRIGVGAVAAQFPQAQILNPAASGVIAIVEQLFIESDTTADVRFSLSNVELANLGTEVAFRDRRIPGAPAIELRNGNAVGAVGTRIFRLPIEAGVTYHIPNLNLLLGQDQGLIIELETVNIELELSLLWSEETT